MIKVFACSLSLVLGATALIATTPNVAASMRAQHIPGMELVVVQHGKVIDDAAYGVKNLQTNVPVDVHTRFEIGSITKQFTAAAILQLEEAGELSLDDPLGKYVPQYAAAKAVTLRQLLWQVSGIPNYTDTNAFKALIAVKNGTLTISKRGTFAAILSLIQSEPLEFAPGTKWQYSNSNYELLGRVVEIASGMSWEEYIRRHIFEPAGMTESSFMSDEPGTGDMATGYATYQGKRYPTSSFYGWAGAAGAIVSTASGLAKWDAALFGGKLLDSDHLAAMTAAGPLPVGAESGARYGFGWMIDTHDGQSRIWHNGGTLGFSSTNQVYSTLGQELIVLTNSGDAEAQVVADAAFDRLHPQLAQSNDAPVAGEDPAVTARAKKLWQEFVKGTIDRSQFTAQANDALTPKLVAEASAQFSQLGSATSWIYRGKDVAASGETFYTYRVSFSSGVTLSVVMSVKKDGKVSTYLARPT
jgi:D-alanyl-D-alanine carboxypeptidase